MRDRCKRNNRESRNKKPYYWANIHPSGYEPHAASSILNWLEGEWALIKSTNKKPGEDVI